MKNASNTSLTETEHCLNSSPGINSSNIRTRLNSTVPHVCISYLNENLILGFHPRWFIVTMGLGVASTILYNFPYYHAWLRVTGIVVFGLDSIILLSLLILFGLHLRNLRRENTLVDFLFDLERNVFLGSMGIGITCWCNMFYFLTKDRCIDFVFVLWWCCISWALFSVVVLLLCIVQKSRLKPEEFTPTVLLPVVTLMVTSSMGHNIYLHAPFRLKLTCLIFSLFLWSIGVILCFMITVVYFFRCMVYKIPHGNAVFTAFIPIGFLGQGSHCIQMFGLYYQNYLLISNPTEYHSEQSIMFTGLIFKNIGLLVGLFLQAFGFYLTILAFAFLTIHKPHKLNFGWWSITYPCGTMSLGTCATYYVTGWEFERVICTIYAGILFAVVILSLGGSTIRFLKSLKNVWLFRYSNV